MLDGEATFLAGFLLGTRETLLETKDGGRTWKQRSIEAAKDEGERSLSLASESVSSDVFSTWGIWRLPPVYRRMACWVGWQMAIRLGSETC